jgi:4-azaleucine resistance transporter AzlC
MKGFHTMPAEQDTELNANRTRSQSITRGMVMALPVVLGYITVGFAYGVLARKAGLPLLHTILMSLVVYAGSAQLISVGLFAAGVQPLSIILTTFIVNIRHMLMSASLASYLEKWHNAEKVAFGLELTDETFALHSSNFSSSLPEKATIFSANVTAQLAWVVGSALGALLGGQVNDIYALGLDFALPAMFIALLVIQIKDRSHILVALAAGLFSLLLYLSGIDQWHVLIAACLAAGIGVWLRSCNQK